MSTVDVVIEPASIEDEAVRAALRGYLADLAERFGRDFDTARAAPPGPGDFEPPRGIFLLVRLGSAVVGCGGVRTESAGVGEIRRMWISPEARGRGVGRALLAELESHARALGCRTVRLDTAAELVEARRLYASSGYREIPAYNDNEYAEHWYEKKLEPVDETGHVRIAIRRYDSPHAQSLIAEFEADLLRRYGEEQEMVISPEEFSPPRGLFLVGYLDGRPVASGGWRRIREPVTPLLAGDAEVNRMYVVPDARGRGLARRMLDAVESSARQAGSRRLVLVTGTAQPEAIELYRSCGYLPMENFGIYRNNAVCRSFAKVLG